MPTPRCVSSVLLPVFLIALQLGSPRPLPAQTTTLADSPNFWGIAQGNGTIVAVGEQGAVFSRGTTGAWRKGNASAPVWLLGVTFGNEKFVAVGAGGAALVSSDGVLWSAASTGVSARLQNVAFANGIFVAVSDAGDILTSVDGLVWKKQNSGTTGWLRGLHYTHSLWIATGQDGTILTSPDAVTWTRRVSGVTAGLDAVANGSPLISIQLPPPSQPIVTSGGDVIVAVGEGGTSIASSDAITWRRGSGFGTTEWVRAIGHFSASSTSAGLTRTHNLFFAVGETGTVRYSDDGGFWSASNSDAPAAQVPHPLRAAIYLGGSILAVGASGAVLEVGQTSATAETLTWSTPSAQGRRLLNISTRGFVGTGSDIMVAGFVIGGDQPERVLIRAIGPGLAAFGLTGVLSFPDLRIKPVTGKILGPTVSRSDFPQVVIPAEQSVGAFASNGALDTSIVTTLGPGIYTAEVSGVGGRTGTVLLEVYELP